MAVVVFVTGCIGGDVPISADGGGGPGDAGVRPDPPDAAPITPSDAGLANEDAGDAALSAWITSPLVARGSAICGVSTDRRSLRCSGVVLAALVPPQTLIRGITMAADGPCILEGAARVRCHTKTGWIEPALSGAPHEVAVGFSSAPGDPTRSGEQACVAFPDRVACWGANGSGQSSPGNSAASTGVTSVGLPTGTWTTLAATQSTVCVVGRGQSYCWGRNTNGERGNGSDGTGTAVATPVAEAQDWLAVAGGWSGTSAGSGGGRFCAAFAGGVSCWGESGGNSALNSLAVSSDAPFVNGGHVVRPSRVPSLAGLNVTAIAIGDDGHQCVLDAAGTASCWGENGSGQSAKTGPSAILTKPAEARAGVDALAAGAGFTCFRDRVTGHVACLGTMSDPFPGVAIAPPLHRGR